MPNDKWAVVLFSGVSRRSPRALAAVLLAALAVPSSLSAEPPVWEVRLRPAIVKPKARVRDGETSLKGDSVFSGSDLDLEQSVPAPAVEAGVDFGADRLWVGAWQVSAEGSSVLATTKAFSGRTLAAGTPVESELEWTSLRLGYLHTFDLAGEWLSADAGLALDRTTFGARLEFPGGEAKTSLRGVFPTPQIALEARPFDPVALRIGLGGFHVGTYPNGDTDAFEPLEYRASVRVGGERFSVEAGYDLYHVHFEEHRDKVEEDVVHMRLRAAYLGFGWRF